MVELTLNRDRANAESLKGYAVRNYGTQDTPKSKTPEVQHPERLT